MKKIILGTLDAMVDEAIIPSAQHIIFIKFSVFLEYTNFIGRQK